MTATEKLQELFARDDWPEADWDDGPELPFAEILAVVRIAEEVAVVSEEEKLDHLSIPLRAVLDALRDAL